MCTDYLDSPIVLVINLGRQGAMYSINRMLLSLVPFLSPLHTRAREQG